MSSSERHRRSAVKSVSYRVLSISVDMAVAYFFTRDAGISIMLVILVDGYSTILYYLHERAWAHISWGRTTPVVPIAPIVAPQRTRAPRTLTAKKTTAKKTVHKKKEVASATSPQ